MEQLPRSPNPLPQKIPHFPTNTISYAHSLKITLIQNKYTPKPHIHNHLNLIYFPKYRVPHKKLKFINKYNNKLFPQLHSQPSITGLSSTNLFIIIITPRSPSYGQNLPLHEYNKLPFSGFAIKTDHFLWKIKKNQYIKINNGHVMWSPCDAPPHFLNFDFRSSHQNSHNFK